MLVSANGGILLQKYRGRMGGVEMSPKKSKPSASSKPTRNCTALFGQVEMTQIKHIQICTVCPNS